MRRPLDSLAGQRFGRLVVIDQELRPDKNQRRTYCRCRCDCGNVVDVLANSLKNGDTQSCGCLRKERPSMVGQRFGRLTVIGQELRPCKTRRYTYCRCRCDCGNKVDVWAHSLKRGHTKSCGCLHKERLLVHGHAAKGRSPTYRTWRGMLQRCNNPNNVSYRNYGGRGISVCERWRNFENFLEDVGERPEGRSLDRIDNDGNYEPGNCRWATAKEQRQNRRKEEQAGKRASQIRPPEGPRIDDRPFGIHRYL